MKCSVCVTGNLRSGFKTQAVQKDFIALFNLTDKKILKRIFSATSPVVIRKGLSLPQAERYRQKLHDIGMEVKIIDNKGKPLQRITDPAEKAASSGASVEDSEDSSVVFYDDDGDDDTRDEENLDLDTPEIGSCSVMAVFSWLSGGFSLFKSAPKFWVESMFQWSLVSGVSWYIMFTMAPLVSMLVCVTFAVFSCTMYTVLMLAAHRIAHNEEPTFTKIREYFNFRTTVAGVVCGILFGIIITAVGFEAFAVTGGDYVMSIGIIVPAVVLVAMACCFIPMLIMVDKRSIPGALRLSFVACKKNLQPLLLFSVLAVVLLVVGALSLGFGLLVVIPVLILTIYQAYNEIFVNA